MDQSEKNFWIAIGLWGATFVTIFGTGAFAFIEDHPYWGLAYCVPSAIGILIMTAYLRGHRLSPNISFAGAALMLTWAFFGYVVFVGPSSKNERAANDITSDFQKDFHYEEITNKKFYNERVLLDGKRFVHCEFTNVTLVYNGTAPVALNNSNFTGGVVFASDNPRIMLTTAILYGIGMIPASSTGLLNIPSSSVIEPPIRLPNK